MSFNLFQIDCSFRKNKKSVLLTVLCRLLFVSFLFSCWLWAGCVCLLLYNQIKTESKTMFQLKSKTSTRIRSDCVFRHRAMRSAREYIASSRLCVYVQLTVCSLSICYCWRWRRRFRSICFRFGFRTQLVGRMSILSRSLFLCINKWVDTVFSWPTEIHYMCSTGVVAFVRLCYCCFVQTAACKRCDTQYVFGYKLCVIRDTCLSLIHIILNVCATPQRNLTHWLRLANHRSFFLYLEIFQETQNSF